MTFAQKLATGDIARESAAGTLRRSISLPGQRGRTDGSGAMTPAYG
jgi:hypothetical protein